MLNNLEGISFDEVVNEKGTSYAFFRAGLKPRYPKVWFDILKGYFFLLLTAALFIFLDINYHRYWWVYVIPAGLLTGYIAAYIALFVHEAGHYNLHPDKKLNDRFATVILCLPFGLSIRSYRKIHWQHHLHLGTPQDTEVSYFNALTELFILETLTGIHLLRTMKKKNNNSILNDQQLKENRLMLVSGLLFHATLLTVVILIGHWAFALAWCLGFGIFFPFFATIRQLLEHRDELAHHTADFTKQPHGKLSRLFAHTVLSSSFGAAGFTRHLIHHWDPQLSYTQLGAAERFLYNCDRTAQLMRSSKTTYFKTVKKLLSAP